MKLAPLTKKTLSLPASGAWGARPISLIRTSKTTNLHSDVLRVVANNLRFRFNQMLYREIFRLLRWTKSSLVHKGGLVTEARVLTLQGSGQLPFWLSRDENGLWRGGQPAWTYLRDLAFSSSGSERISINRQLLAQLPAGVSYQFVFGPQVENAEIMKSAFKRAGFNLREVETYVCTQRMRSGDLINTLTGKSIKGTLRRAKRDLEIIEISAREFFCFHDKNLLAASKPSYRDSISDRIMLEEALRHGHARILAARKKQSPADPHSLPIDAASACLWDEADGFYKLWRTSHRCDDAANPTSRPHPDASKLLVLTAMEDAAAKNLTLDSDGSTPGHSNYFALFGPGIFRRTTRLHCEHETLRSIINRYYPSIFLTLNSFRPEISRPREA